MRAWAAAVVVVALSVGVQAVGVSIAPVTGAPDAPAMGQFTLDPPEPERGPSWYRCAQTYPDLDRSDRTPITVMPITFTRLLPGYQAARDNVVLCEVGYGIGPSVIVSAVEDMRARAGGGATLPTAFLHPASGVLFRLASVETASGVGAWPLVQYNDQGLSTMRYGPGNNFAPLDWSEDGYAWSSEATRAVDKGEPRRNTVMVAHVYARWLGPNETMDWSASSTALLVDLAGDGLDLHGGRAYFAVLMALPDGRHARYHLRRPLAIVNGSWSQTGWYVPSGTSADWQCSFASNGMGCGQMPSPGPDLHYIEAVEIVITDGDAPPTGVIKIRDLQVWQ